MHITLAQVTRKGHKNGDMTKLLAKLALVLRGHVNATISNIKVHTITEGIIIPLDGIVHEVTPVILRVQLIRLELDPIATIVCIGNIGSLTTPDNISKQHILAGALQTANGNISGLEKFDHLTHKPKISLMPNQITTKGTAKMNRIPIVDSTVSVISIQPVSSTPEP